MYLYKPSCLKQDGFSFTAIAVDLQPLKDAKKRKETTQQRYVFIFNYFLRGVFAALRENHKLNYKQ